MTGLLVCVSAAALGVDYGWQPVAGGGIEYIIQIEPALVESLKEGRDLFSDLPSSVSNVRRYRITVGSGRLPHHGEPPPAVIQASGEMQAGSTGAAKSDPIDSAEIDLSELPGPVLGPAMVFEPPAEKNQEPTQEPRHLAESNNTEATNVRQTETHEPHGREPPASAKVKTDTVVETAAVEPPAIMTHQTERSGPSKEVESASDQSPPKAETSLTSKSAMTLMGLFFSVACNVVFLFVVADQRTKYRAMVRRMFESRSPSLTADYDASLPRWERLPAPEQPGSLGNVGDETHRT